MGGTAHPSLLFALTAGFLTALTPCVYPMIPITISIFGAKAGQPRGRALALATFYVAGHRRHVRRARHHLRAPRQGVRDVPGQSRG